MNQELEDQKVKDCESNVDEREALPRHTAGNTPEISEEDSLSEGSFSEDSSSESFGFAR